MRPTPRRCQGRLPPKPQTRERKVACLQQYCPGLPIRDQSLRRALLSALIPSCKTHLMGSFRPTLTIRTFRRGQNSAAGQAAITIAANSLLNSSAIKSATNTTELAQALRDAVDDATTDSGLSRGRVSALASMMQASGVLGGAAQEMFNQNSVPGNVWTFGLGQVAQDMGVSPSDLTDQQAFDAARANDINLRGVPNSQMRRIGDTVFATTNPANIGALVS